MVRFGGAFEAGEGFGGDGIVEGDAAVEEVLRDELVEDHCEPLGKGGVDGSREEVVFNICGHDLRDQVLTLDSEAAEGFAEYQVPGEIEGEALEPFVDVDTTGLSALFAETTDAEIHVTLDQRFVLAYGCVGELLVHEMSQLLMAKALGTDQAGEVAVGLWIFGDLGLVGSPAVDIVPCLRVGVR